MADNGHYVKMIFFCKLADMLSTLDARNQEVAPSFGQH